jgi:hypothetical protein
MDEPDTKIMELVPESGAWGWILRPTVFQQRLVIWSALVAVLAFFWTITLLCVMLVISTSGW